MKLKEEAAYIVLLVAGSALDGENPFFPAVLVLAALAVLLGQATGKWQ